MLPPLTGWMFTDATRQVGCPKCGSKAGEECRTPAGRKTRYPHDPRVEMLLKRIPAHFYSHKVGSTS